MKITWLILGVLGNFAPCAIHAQAGPNYIQFGKMVVDASDPTYIRQLTSLSGTIRSVNDGIVILDAYKSGFLAPPPEGNAAVGAYSGPIDYSYKEFDGTAAITNCPDLNEATIGRHIIVRAMRIGTLTVEGEAGSAEPASRPAVETHRRDVATLNAFVIIGVNLMFAATCAGMIVFILVLPPR